MLFRSGNPRTRRSAMPMKTSATLTFVRRTPKKEQTCHGKTLKAESQTRGHSQNFFHSMQIGFKGWLSAQSLVPLNKSREKTLQN